MILLVGGTGMIGAFIASTLAEQGRDVAALVRSDRAAAALPAGVKPIRGDLDDGPSLRAAMDGARRLMLITPSSPRQALWETAAIDAALAAQVERIVKLSVLDAAPGFEPATVREHREVERHLATSPVEHTIVRTDWFASNVVAQRELIRGGILTYPHGEALTATVDPRDVADVAVHALVDHDHGDTPGRMVEVTGPEALSFRDHAAGIERVCGLPVRFLEASDDDFRGGLLAMGMPKWNADALVELIQGYALRTSSPVAPGVQEVLGRPARSFDTYLAEVFDPIVRTLQKG